MYYKLNTHSSIPHSGLGYSNQYSNINSHQQKSLINQQLNSLQTIYQPLLYQYYNIDNQARIYYTNSNFPVSSQKISENKGNQNFASNYSQTIINPLFVNPPKFANYNNVSGMKNNFLYGSQPSQNSVYINSSNLGPLYQNPTTNYSAGVIFDSNSFNKNFENTKNINQIYYRNPERKIENTLLYPYLQSKIYIPNSNNMNCQLTIQNPLLNSKRSITPINASHHDNSNDFKINSPLDTKTNNMTRIQQENLKSSIVKNEKKFYNKEQRRFNF